MCRKWNHLILLLAIVLLVAGPAGAKLVAHWPLNEGTGTTVADISGNNHTGTLQGTPTWVPGPVGYGLALSWNGSNPAAGYVDCGTWNPSAGTGQLSVAFWARWRGPIGPDNWQGLVGKRDSWDDTGAGAGSMWEIEINATNNQVSFFRGGSYPNSGGRILPIDEWVHIAVTFDGATAIFHINGQETGRGGFSFGPKTDAMITIGCDNNGGWNAFNGALDEVRLYDNALPLAEVKKLSAQFGATKPSPADGSIHPFTWANLTWTTGGTAVSHDIYFGTSYDDVLNGTGNTFLRNQFGTSLIVGFPTMPFPQGLALGQTYYWRVDEVEQNGTKHKGLVWSFLVPSKKAFRPNPADGSKFVDPNADLSWNAGLGGIIHHVYLGQDFNDVNTAAVPTYSTGATTHDPGTLPFDTTYYWRIDEFDGAATHKGDVWSFTTTLPGLGSILMETYENIPGTDLAGLKTSVNYPGNPTTRELLTSFDAPGWGDAKSDYGGRLTAWLHVPLAGDYTFWVAGDDQTELWLSLDDDPTNAKLIASVPEWTDPRQWDKFPSQKSEPITLESGRYFIMALWKEGSGGDHCAAAWQGPGIPTRSVIAGTYLKAFEALSAYGAKPYSGATGVPQSPILSWKPGTKAARHEVYFGDSEAKVADANTSTAGVYQGSQALDQTSFDPGALQWGQTYYWRVDEVNDAHPNSPWPGTVWSFTTADFLVVDDFESYDNDVDAKTTIYDTWTDGLIKGNGSQVGYWDPPFAEQVIVNSGRQSMPLTYNNADSPFYSEAERSWTTNQNWTVNGVKNLTLFVRGNPVAFQEEGGVVTMSGSGHDIWDNADDFRYAYKRLSGNGSITARVESLVNTNDWAKAGVMIRESLDPGSRFTYLIVSATQGVSFGWRQFSNDVCDSRTQAGVGAPQYVKLTRTGDAFTAQYSADGAAWTDMKNTDGTVASITLAMTGSIYAGLCVTSHDTALTTTAVLSNITTSANITGAWQVAEIGDDPQGGNSPQTLYVGLEDGTTPTPRSFFVVNPDTTLVTTTAWTEWTVPLTSFTGVSPSKIRRIFIGVGNPTTPIADGRGLIYIDDIRVTRP